MKRSAQNPILTRADIPPTRPDLADVSSVFNPGAALFGARELLVLRVQTRARETVLFAAERLPRGRYDIRPEPIRIEGLEDVGPELFHVYDPRLSVIDDVLYLVFAADTDEGCRLGIARTTDFERFELVSFDTEGDTRNGVLFPERIQGRYLRLERPNRDQPDGGPPTGSCVILSESEDLVSWSAVADVFSGRPRRWDEWVGSGPPPLRVEEGWLHLYHGVATHFASSNIYQAGVVLLDADAPERVLARSRGNVLEPREPYELMGQVPNVVFPSGWVALDLDSDGRARSDSRIRIYYGAADTVVAVAETTVSDLMGSCEPAEDR